MYVKQEKNKTNARDGIITTKKKKYDVGNLPMIVERGLGD